MRNSSSNRIGNTNQLFSDIEVAAMIAGNSGSSRSSNTGNRRSSTNTTKSSNSKRKSRKSSHGHSVRDKARSSPKQNAESFDIVYGSNK